ncbi:S8 family serine peptidase [Polyangium jinanense]|uniref:S8 family serine peptidase n=1 Tax=Polyangium jinanense TaxID=2829994 RepID=A0A9X3XB20_9BACT|nr:S8 family serine peptidase [Polyangium jinanense]MDC3962277.1 S8 family serine peptidase [Polyangium jinanense]MDC3962550.1 S8 family serine peptidase [Polyangium jinanense]MDC3985458.1 S8 family serine peptidase [Polyangium jinanense]
MTHNLRYSLALVLASLGLAACAIGADEGEEDVGAAPVALSAEGRYIIKFKDYSRRGASIAAAGGKVARDLPEQAASAVYLPDVAVQAMANNPNVEYVEVDQRRELYGQTTPYGISMVQATDAAFSSASGSTKVCIIDSGFHAGHADLQGLPVTGESGTSWNTDSCGHGTHVAGTIAAVNNSLGVVGVAPDNVSLHIVKVFDGADCAWSYSSDLVAALNECRSAGAKVVSMSLGGSFSSNTENAAFDSAYAAGVLSIAAAGNGGNNRTSYPAGYASVMSVAAVDSAKAKADFSQYNADVEITAPGVQVLSTVPWTTPTLTVGSGSYAGSIIDGAAAKSVSGALVDGGLCDAVGSWAGKIVLCQRGTVSFADKVNNAQAGGAAGAVIYNNVSGGFAGTLNGTSAIPAIGISMEDGQALVASSLGASGALNTVQQIPGTGYEAWDGTSMATPHVSAVAALIWSQKPAATNNDVRNALTSTAEDLGAAGRDVNFGYGLVRAKNALDALLSGSGGGPTCGASGATCAVGSDCCSGTCGVKGKKVCK